MAAVSRDHIVIRSIAISRRVIRASTWALLGLYVLFLCLLLVLRHWVLPDAAAYKPWIESQASQALGLKVQIGELSARLEGVSPQLSALNVTVTDAQGQQVLALGRVDATVSWVSVATLEMVFDTLRVDKPDVQVRHLGDGRLSIAGILVDPQRPSGGREGLGWLLAQHELQVRDGRLSWVDETRELAPLTLEHVNFLMHNLALSHRFGLSGQPPAQFGSAVDVRGSFRHGVFSARDNIDAWTGELYVQMQRLDVAEWVRYFAGHGGPGDAAMPLAVRNGQGAVRAWMAFENRTARRITADMELADLALQVGKDVPALDLASLSGRLEGRQLQRGTLSHELSARQLVFNTHDGKRVGPLNFTESYAEPLGKSGAKGSLTVDTLDLGMLADLSGRLPLTVPVRQALSSFAPSGVISQLSVQWQAPPASAPDEDTRFTAKGRFAGLTLAAQQDRMVLKRLLAPQLVHAAPGVATPEPPGAAPGAGLPGFANLTGTFDMDQASGRLSVNSQAAQLVFPHVFEEPTLSFDKLALEADWKIQGKDVKVEVSQATVSSPHLNGFFKAIYHVGEKIPASIELDGRFAQVQANVVHKYLPIAIEASARHWVRDAIKSGQAREVQFHVKGPLAHIPYPLGSDGKSAGEFSVSARVDNVALDYVPIVLQGGARWSAFEAVNGRFVMNHADLMVQDASARIMKTRISKVEVKVVDLVKAGASTLLVNGETEGPAQDLVSYVNASPVVDWIGGITQHAQISGTSKLALKLAIPLYEGGHGQATGSVQFAGNNILVDSGLPTLSGTTGTLEFTEKSVQVRNVRTNLYGGAASLSGGTQADGSLSFRGEGTADIAQARDLLGEPTLSRILSLASGNCRYTIALDLRAGQPDLKLRSDLVGVSFDFPGVVSKTAAQVLPLTVSLTPQRGAGGVAVRDELAVSLGPALNARFERVRNAKGAMVVTRGGIGINNEAVMSEAGTNAVINLKSFDVDTWSKKLNELDLDVAGGGVFAPNSEGVSLVPRWIAVQADEMIIGGKRFEKVVAGATRDGSLWQVNIDAIQASGYVTWRNDPRLGVLGRVSAKLARLTIPQGQRDDVAAMLDEAGSSQVRNLPGIDLTVDSFELAGRKLGMLEVTASNVRTPFGAQWKLEKLSLGTPAAQLAATGIWRRVAEAGNGAGVRVMDLDFTLTVKDAGGALTVMGMPNTMRNGQGKLVGKLSWRGTPFAIDYPSLSGDLKLELDKGQFLKTEPGVARLLGILSMQSLMRRFTFDFRDVFSEGFAYDTVRAEAQVANGILSTNSFKMKGPQAAVAMEGTIDLAHETQNLHVAVLPDVNFGAVSVAYLFINPAIGLASLLAQMVARDPLSKSFAQEYDVQGTWNEPLVKKREKLTAQANPQTGAGQ